MDCSAKCEMPGQVLLSSSTRLCRTLPNSLQPWRILPKFDRNTAPSRSRRRVRPVDGQVVIDAVQRNEKCKFRTSINTHTDIVPHGLQHLRFHLVIIYSLVLFLFPRDPISPVPAPAPQVAAPLSLTRSSVDNFISNTATDKTFRV